MPLELLREDEWLARRQLSASRIASVFTERFGELTLWAILTGKEEEEFPELLGDFGRATERVSRKWFERRTNLDIQPRDPLYEYPGGKAYLISGPGSVLTASPDTVVWPAGADPAEERPSYFAEHKTCDRVVSWKWSNGPDRYAWVQSQATYAAADEANLRLSGAYATVLIGNGYNAERDFQVFEVERDEDFIGEIRNWAERFRTRYVEADVPPPPDGLRATLETIRLLFPPRLKDDDRKLGVLPANPWAGQYKELTRLEKSIDTLKRRHKRIKQEIEFAMGEADLDEASIAATEEMPNPPRFARLAYERKGYTVKPTRVKRFQELK